MIAIVVDPQDSCAVSCQPRRRSSSLLKDEDAETKIADSDVSLSHTETTDASESSYSCFEESSSCSGNLSYFGAAVPVPVEPLHSSSSLLLDNVREDELPDNEEMEEESALSTIRFSAEIQCHDILPLFDYSTEEKWACWYTANEYAAMQSRAKELIVALECGGEETPADLGIVDDIDFSSSSPARGLEHYFEMGATSADRNYSLAMKAVFEEQQYQKQIGTYDEMAIAKQYRKVSLRCRFPARKMALQDQEEATKYFRAGGVSCKY